MPVGFTGAGGIEKSLHALAKVSRKQRFRTMRNKTNNYGCFFASSASADGDVGAQRSTRVASSQRLEKGVAQRPLARREPAVHTA